MPPQLGRQALGIAAWIVVVSVVLLFFLERGTAEYVITQFSLGLGLVFGTVVVFLIRRSMK